MKVAIGGSLITVRREFASIDRPSGIIVWPSRSTAQFANGQTIPSFHIDETAPRHFCDLITFEISDIGHFLFTSPSQNDCLLKPCLRPNPSTP
jgi:hypothetical protein